MASVEGFSISFEGSKILVSDLKQAIRKKCGITTCDLDLFLRDDDQKRVREDNEFIQSYSHVIVKRKPIIGGAKNHRNNKTINPENFNKTDPYKTINHKGVGEIFKNINLATSDLTDDQKLDTIVESVTNNYKFVGKKIPYGCPPSNYTCNKCGVPGHWINLCPGVPDINGKLLNSRDVKRPSGIPTSSLKIVDENTPNSYLTAEGRYVVNIKNHEAFLIGKKEKRPFSIEENPPPQVVKEDDIPAHLKCNLCLKLVNRPMNTPCCNMLYCELCITEHLFVANSSGVIHTCPNCGEKVDKLDSLKEANELVNLIVDWPKRVKTEPIKDIEPKVEPSKTKSSEMTDDDLLNEIFFLNDKENSCPDDGLMGYENVQVKKEIEEDSTNQQSDIRATEVIKQLANCGGDTQIQEFIKANPQVVQVIQGIIGNIQSNQVQNQSDRSRNRSRSRPRYEERNVNNQSIPVLNSDRRHQKYSDRSSHYDQRYSRNDEYNNRRPVDDRHPYRASGMRERDERGDTRYHKYDRRDDHEFERDYKYENDHKIRSSHRRSPIDEQRIKSRRIYDDQEEKKIKENSIERSSGRSNDTIRARYDRSRNGYEDRKYSSKYYDKRADDREMSANNFVERYPNREQPVEGLSKERELVSKPFRSRSRSAVKRAHLSDNEFVARSDGEDGLNRDKKTKHKSHHKKSKKSKKDKLKSSDKKKHKKPKHSD